RVWVTSSGEPVTLPWRHDGPIRDLTFSPDGKRVATAGDDKVAKVWMIPAGDRPAEGLIAMAEFLAGEMVSAGGTLITPDTSTVAPTWQRLHRSPENVPQPTTTDRIAFHDKELKQCEELHRWPEALIHASELIRLSPEDWRVYHRRGIVLRNLGRFREA